jgi:hypothetical protein
LSRSTSGTCSNETKKEASLLTYLAGEGFTVISGLVELVIKEKEEISRALLPFLLQKTELSSECVIPLTFMREDVE